MRFSRQIIPVPTTTRLVSHFLWLPLGLNIEGTSNYEVRWLERVTILQRAEADWDYPWGVYWKDLSFVDHESVDWQECVHQAKLLLERQRRAKEKRLSSKE